MVRVNTNVKRIEKIIHCGIICAIWHFAIFAIVFGIWCVRMLFIPDSPLEWKEDLKITQPVEIEALKAYIYLHNAANVVYNEGLYPDPFEFVIIVQVHNRPQYLVQLIESLSNVNKIETALVIFSHDYISEAVNDLILNIRFARVLQIFYPYSIQTHPDVFPGTNPDDCTNPPKSSLKCKNIEWTDIAGNYRQANATQTKHHWWWKGHYVFKNLKLTKNYTGHFIFLEEDNYVTPDMLYQVFLRTSLFENKDVDIFVIGKLIPNALSFRTGNETLTTDIEWKWTNWFLTQYSERYFQGAANLETWNTKDNIGMVMNKMTWLKITSCAKMFCKWDDCNWDLTLENLAYSCLHTHLTTLVLKAPRVFHIGECGLHYDKGQFCNGTANVPLNFAKNLTNTIKHLLFLSHTKITTTTPPKRHPIGASGGWGDPRDQELCMELMHTATP